MKFKKYNMSAFKRFVTPVCIHVTKEEYHKHLYEPLRKMGYIPMINFNIAPDSFYLITNYNGYDGVVSIKHDIKHDDIHHKVQDGKYGLFLALAAMTDIQDAAYSGELVLNHENKLVKARRIPSLETDVTKGLSDGSWRKLTKDEIIEYDKMQAI